MNRPYQPLITGDELIDRNFRDIAERLGTFKQFVTDGFIHTKEFEIEDWHFYLVDASTAFKQPLPIPDTDGVRIGFSEIGGGTVTFEVPNDVEIINSSLTPITSLAITGIVHFLWDLPNRRWVRTV